MSLGVKGLKTQSWAYIQHHLGAILSDFTDMDVMHLWNSTTLSSVVLGVVHGLILPGTAEHRVCTFVAPEFHHFTHHYTHSLIF